LIVDGKNMEIKRSSYAQGYGATIEWFTRKLAVESKLERTTF
jgi:hypothetical protein